MVFGLGRGGGQPAAPAMGGGVTSPQLDAATAELDMITDAFNKLVSVCHNKCISTRYLEPDLNKGESVCVDRCVSKFFQVNAKVGEKMQTIGQQGAGAAGGSGGGSFF